MNSMYNSALKQKTAIASDLSAFSSLSPNAPNPALSGQISASITSFSRTIDQYADLSRHELNQQKAEKAAERLVQFRQDLSAFKSEFDKLKREREQQQHAFNQSELFGPRPHNTSTPENPYSGAGASTSTTSASGPYARGGGGGGSGLGSGDVTREAHALREQDFFANTHSALDEYLARGQAVLGDLGQQRELLKNTQKRLYGVANTLGVSGDTIRMVERRAKEDKWIFGGGVVIFFTFCWLVLKYLR